MALFEAREEVFCRRDRAGWKAAREALKAAGIRGVRAGHCESAPPVGGCGCKLDIRNFGPCGRIDRELYFISVPAAEADQAREVLKTEAHGLARYTQKIMNKL